MQQITITIPYSPGFLAFREVPVYMQLLQDLQQHRPGLCF